MSVEMIQLGLSRATKPFDVRRLLADAVGRALTFIDQMPAESGGLDASEFVAQLRSFQTEIVAAPNENAAASVLHLCLDACQDYFMRARGYVTERETELNEVIKVLQEALAELAGQSNEFHGSLLSTTERFNQMTKIEDLRHLRNAIAQEVGELKKFVAEKQKRDQANFTRLSKRIDGLRSKLKEAKEEATLDKLTRLANRGGFDAAIQNWIIDYEKRDVPFVLAMLDIDDFKRINDTHGHLIGDRVLVCAAQWLTSNVRGEDFLARYGGEEFAVLLCDVRLKQAESKFTTFLERVAESSYQYDKNGEKRVMQFTFSCGLAEYSPADSAESLISRADEALYQAKESGKNQVRGKSRHLLRGFFGT